MSYRIPSVEVLAVAISEVLREHGAAPSQRSLGDMVREKIRTVDPGYAVSDERVRKVAVQSGLVKIEVETRDTGKKARIGRCPVCGSRLSRVRNETIYGGTVILRYRCRSCPFSMGKTRAVPTRYVFHDAMTRARIPNKDSSQSRL
jgi:hypothetical protein